MKKYILVENIILKFDEVSNRYYAFCISTGDHFILTKSGYFILEFLEMGKDINEIISFVHKNENIDLDTCKRDTLNFINKSEKIGIISILKEEQKNDKKEHN